MAKVQHSWNLRANLTSLFETNGNIYFSWGEKQPERIVVEIVSCREDIGEAVRTLRIFGVDGFNISKLSPTKWKIRIYNQGAILSFITLVRECKNKKKKIKLRQAKRYIELHNLMLGKVDKFAAC